MQTDVSFRQTIQTPDHEMFRKLVEERGFSLIVLNGKRPVEKDWTRYCREWRHFEDIPFQPQNNAGICCGPASGIVVLDIDDPQLFELTLKENGWTIPSTFTVRTGSGKLHLYFAYPNDGKTYGTTYHKDKGFEIRGDGAQVVAPGSIHPDTGKPYYIEKDVPIASLPDWLFELIDGQYNRSKEKCNETVKIFPTTPDAETILDSYPLSTTIKDLIRRHTDQGLRSNAIWKVLCACGVSNLPDNLVAELFENLPISEKCLEKGDIRKQWLLEQYEKAKREVREPRTFPQEAATDLIILPEADKCIRPPLVEMRAPINGISHEQLTVPAHNLIIGALESHGNKLSDAHKKALFDLVKVLTCVVQGELRGRLVFPLPTGSGKTLSITLWLCLLNKLECKHIGVAVCAYRVETLCEIKRTLIANGVPENDIGLIHSYRYDNDIAVAYLEGREELPEGYASFPTTKDNRNRQIVLVTHSRVKNPSSFKEYGYYRDNLRDLFIWDESFLASTATAFSLNDLIIARDLLTRDERFRYRLQPFLPKLSRCIDTFEEEHRRQTHSGCKPRFTTLPAISQRELERFQNELEILEEDSTASGYIKTLRKFLGCYHQKHLVVITKQGTGIVSLGPSIPDELENVVILDASYDIRLLERMDPQLKLVRYAADHIVSYENVTIHQLEHASGRDSITREFKKNRREDRLLVREVIEVIKRVPQNEGILIITLKPRKTNFADILMKDMEAEGIDPNAIITVNGVQKRRFAWLTWGRETSTSEYSYCSTIIIVGVLHLRYIDLAAQSAGQKQNFRPRVDNYELGILQRSEIAHRVYQAISRGTCRVIRDGKASPANVYIIHQDRNLISDLRTVMPGVKLVEWRPKYLGNNTKLVTISWMINDHLNQLSPTIMSISTQKLAKDLGLTGDPSWSKALYRALHYNPEWKLVRQHLQRVG